MQPKMAAISVAADQRQRGLLRGLLGGLLDDLVSTTEQINGPTDDTTPK